MKFLKFKKFCSVVLSIALIMSVSAICCVEVSAATGKITYTFEGDEKDKAGYAQGTVELSAVPDGDYNLYWAGENKALDGYYEIDTLTVKNGKGTFTFGDHTAIPVDAKKLIACSGDTKTVSDAVALYDIPSDKMLGYSSDDANYTFMNYSDIHIDCQSNVYYEYSELHWEKALETASNRDADFIITAGDNITNAEGPSAEFDKYQEILADSPYVNPIYEESGNHELRTGEAGDLLSTFVSATGLDGKRSTIKENKPYYTVEQEDTGDLFIFMALEYEYDPQDGDEFSQQQLDWLKTTLEENYDKNKNIYLIQHALIESYGAGDDEDNYYTVPLSPDYDTTNQFREIIESYPDIIWISGHTHIALEYGYNYSDMDSTSCHMIHDSSVCCPTLLSESSHSLSYIAHDSEKYKDLSEGYYVQVFDDEIIFNGENLYHDKIYPASCYIMESCRTQSTEEGDTLKSTTLADLPDIQQLNAYVIGAVTMPKSSLCEGVTEQDMKQLVNNVKETLDEFYTFSSYDAYQNLKKIYEQLVYASYDSIDNAYAELSSAYVEFLPYTMEGEITLYYENTKGWDTVYAQLSSAKNNNGDGEEMEFVETNSDGNDIYKISVNYNNYKEVVFTDGTKAQRTNSHTISLEDNKLYYANAADSSSPFFCLVTDYTSSSKEE